MKLGKPLAATLSTLENRLFSVIGVLLGINTLFFIAPQTTSLTFLRIAESNNLFYTGFALLGTALLGAMFYYNRPTAWRALLRKLLFTTFPAWFILTYGLIESKNFHYLFQIAQSA